MVCDPGQPVDANEKLWRRLHPNFWVRDGSKQSGWRISAGAFKSSERGSGGTLRNISVNVASMTTEEATMQGYPEHGLAEISVAEVNRLGLSAVHDPLPDNAAHALVVMTSCPSKSTLAQLAEGARVIRPPSE